MQNKMYNLKIAVGAEAVVINSYYHICYRAVNMITNLMSRDIHVMMNVTEVRNYTQKILRSRDILTSVMRSYALARYSVAAHVKIFGKCASLYCGLRWCKKLICGK